jgi:hypothetical protein
MIPVKKPVAVAAADSVLSKNTAFLRVREMDSKKSCKNPTKIFFSLDCTKIQCYTSFGRGMLPRKFYFFTGETYGSKVCTGTFPHQSCGTASYVDARGAREKNR